MRRSAGAHMVTVCPRCRPRALATNPQASYTFSLPYVYAVQTLGLSFHVKLWYDGPGQRLRTDVYGGLDSTLAVGVSDAQRHPVLLCQLPRAVEGQLRVVTATAGPDSPLHTCCPPHTHTWHRRVIRTCCTRASTRPCARRTTTPWARPWQHGCWPPR
jgi:hypothetical protein